MFSYPFVDFNYKRFKFYSTYFKYLDFYATAQGNDCKGKTYSCRSNRKIQGACRAVNIFYIYIGDYNECFKCKY